MERSYESAAALAGRATGPLSEHLNRFVDSLVRQQYVPAVVYVKALRALAFDRWLARQRIALADVAEPHIARFERRRRRCRGHIRTETKRRERSDLNHLLRYLRTIGACHHALRSVPPAADCVAAYERHLRQQQGLSTSSIERYGDVAQQFLVHRFGDGAVDLHALHDDAARRYLFAMADLSRLEGDEIASAQLAVDAEVEDELACATLHLERDAECPGILWLEGRLLPDNLAPVQRLATNGTAAVPMMVSHRVEEPSRMCC